ncbi:MAG: D-alanyl-D-alanine carboxypeptidase [Clostridia bacterium]|nr:D-alanyl-D-alanine carboxypeptidase [Clostridia bacterium]
MSNRILRGGVALFLCAALLVSSFAAVILRAIDTDDGVYYSETTFDVSQEVENSSMSDEAVESSEYSEIEESSKEEIFPEIDVITPENVTAAAIYELDSLYCVYSENANERVSIASITKLMTACVALKYMPPEAMITVGGEIGMVKPDSSLCGLRRGYKMTLYDLLHGLLMQSGNDAAYTVAVNVARYASENYEMDNKTAVEYFCALMNEQAEDLGLENTSFANPEGWDNENNYSTVSDLSILARCAANQEMIAKIVKTVNYTVALESGEELEFFNSNFLLHPESRFYHKSVTGLKTGSTNKAGKCLVATLEIDGRRYIAVVMGCPNEESRYISMLEIIKYVEEYHALKFA